eukprot:1955883-Amphidinium_carterae.1
MDSACLLIRRSHEIHLRWLVSCIWQQASTRLSAGSSKLRIFKPGSLSRNCSRRASLSACGRPFGGASVVRVALAEMSDAQAV